MRDKRPVEEQGEVGHVLGLTGEVTDACRRNRDGALWEHVVDDREVVHGEVPYNVYVMLKQAKIHADGVVVEDLTQSAGAGEVVDFAYGSRVHEGVVHHQHKALACSLLHEP